MTWSCCVVGQTFERGGVGEDGFSYKNRNRLPRLTNYKRYRIYSIRFDHFYFDIKLNRSINFFLLDIVSIWRSWKPDLETELFDIQINRVKSISWKQCSSVKFPKLSRHIFYCEGMVKRHRIRFKNFMGTVDVPTAAQNICNSLRRKKTFNCNFLCENKLRGAISVQ